MSTEFFKVYGTKERNDGLLRLSDDHYVLFYGFHKDNESDESGVRIMDINLRSQNLKKILWGILTN